MTTFLREAFRVKRRSYPERIRAALFLAIKRTAANLDACVKLPGKDFSRTRKLPLQAMLLMLIGMGSGSLSKELYDWFGYTSSTATASAFVQQRNKIRPEAVKMIFDFLLQEVFARLIFYNYASLIARQVPAPQGKQINFSVAILACKQFLKGKIRSAQIFEILSMHLSPIRPGRQYKRYQNPVSAVAFQYRLS